MKKIKEFVTYAIVIAFVSTVAGCGVALGFFTVAALLILR